MSTSRQPSSPQPVATIEDRSIFLPPYKRAAAEATWEASRDIRRAFQDRHAFIEAVAASHGMPTFQSVLDHQVELEATESTLARLAIRELSTIVGDDHHAARDVVRGAPEGRVFRSGPDLEVLLIGPFTCCALASDSSVGADWVIRALEEHADARRVYFRVASAGGSIDEAWQIAERIRASREPKYIAVIDAYAFSAATIVAAACDHVLMLEHALWMAHLPWRYVSGDASGLRSAADDLETEGRRLLDFYLRMRPNLPADSLGSLLSEGRVLSAREAISIGFADAIFDPLSTDLPMLGAPSQ